MEAGQDLYDVEIDSDDFSRRLQQGERLLISFGATWCGPCKQMLPTLRMLGSALEGQICVGRIETDLHPEIGKRFQIRAYPTLVLFDGGAERGRVIGLQSASQIKRWIEKTLPVRQPTDSLSMIRPDWGAFYGNEVLRKCLVEEVLQLVANGKIAQSRFPSWTDGSGSLSAALVKSDNPDVFERLTGMPYSFALTLELADPRNEAAIARLFESLPAGADVAEVLPRQLIGWLASEEEQWATHLADDALNALRLRWVGLMEARFAGSHVAEDDWGALREAVIPWCAGARERELDWHFGRFIREMSPPPALDAQAAVWMPIYPLMTMLQYYLTMIQAGATPEVLETPNKVHQWFKSRWTIEAWQAASPEEQDAEHAQMRSELKSLLEAQAAVEARADLIRTRALERRGRELLVLLARSPAIRN